MGQSSRKMTKIKIGRPSDKKCEANCTEHRVASLSDEQREMAYHMLSYGLEGRNTTKKKKNQ